MICQEESLKRQWAESAALNAQLRGEAPPPAEEKPKEEEPKEEEPKEEEPLDKFPTLPKGKIYRTHVSFEVLVLLCSRILSQDEIEVKLNDSVHTSNRNSLATTSFS